MDEELIEKKPTLLAINKESLDELSIEELGLRINILEQEIKRCSEKIKSKENSKRSAEDVFK
mgnify:FL=1